MIAAIRYELGEKHSFDFVEGCIPYEADSSEFRMIFKQSDLRREMNPVRLTSALDFKHMLPAHEKTWTYFGEDTKTAVSAVEHLEAFVEIEGTYDGVITFSQGSALVATWMAHRLRHGKTSFRCAIFLSASVLGVDLGSLREGNFVTLSHAKMGEVIDIPTAHVWGVADPYAEIAREFSLLCDSSVRSVATHSGGHEVPGPKSKDDLINTVNAIRRAIFLAEMAG